MPAKAKAKKEYGLGRKGIGHAEMDLEVPSGALCRVKRPGPMGLIKLGLLDSLDSLTALVKTEHFDRVDNAARAKPTMDDIKEFAGNAESVKAGFDMVDKIVIGCVVAPEISPLPRHPETGEVLPESQWDPEKTYINSVELHDKLYILQFVVGGTPDLESFRKERNQFMGDLPNV